MAHKKNKTAKNPGINNEDDVKKVFPENIVVPGWWVNFNILEEESFLKCCVKPFDPLIGNSFLHLEWMGPWMGS